MIRLLTNIIELFALVIAVLVAVFRMFAPRKPANRADGGHSGGNEANTRRHVKRWVFEIAPFLVVAAFAGFLLVVSGVMPIKASSGHWPITAWFLEFAMRRSIVTHSLGIEVPPLQDRALILKGAGHYEIGCRPCHGSPELAQMPRISRAMTPPPPNLSREIPKWNARQLFTIVKHGVKFTGMPAWPAQQRDDEVWAVVAFMLVLPSLTAEEYKRLVRAEKLSEGTDAPIRDLSGPQPPTIIESCAGCHGADGSGRGVAAFPKLAGQKPQYFAASMQAYALGRRTSGIMEPIAVALSREAVADLARHYANLKTKQTSGEFPQGVTAMARPTSQNPSSGPETAWRTALVDRGREIAARGIPSRRVPPCVECHGPSAVERNPNYPTLAGQYAEYLVLQLTLFQNNSRGGTPFAHLMRPVAAGLTAQNMRDVALYYQSLGPPGTESN